MLAGLETLDTEIGSGRDDTLGSESMSRDIAWDATKFQLASWGGG